VLGDEDGSVERRTGVQRIQPNRKALQL